MKVAVLVVTYNRKELLAENIKAIRNQTYTNFDFYICDNASTDGTAELLQEMMAEESRVKYYNTGKNLGGAGGFSYGLKLILKQDYKYCWIMDDDSIPEDDALEILVNRAESLGGAVFSFLACNVLWTDGKPCRMNEVSVLEDIVPESGAQALGLKPIDRCSFVGCFVNVAVAKRIALPIKEFFIYGDDTEYTLRLSERKPAYFCPESGIVHKMPSNNRIGIAEAAEDRIDRYRYEYRNLIYIYRNRRKMPWIKITGIYLKECVKILLRSRSKKMKRIRIVLCGLYEGAKFHPQEEYIAG